MYDMFLNACCSSSQKREMRKTLKYFKMNGVTQKQVNVFIKKTKANGINVPNVYQQLFDRSYGYYDRRSFDKTELLVYKLKKSINHYKKEGGNEYGVIINYV